MGRFRSGDGWRVEPLDDPYRLKAMLRVSWRCLAGTDLRYAGSKAVEAHSVVVEVQPLEHDIRDNIRSAATRDMEQVP